MTNNYSTPYTARSVSTAPAHRQAEKFFTADFVQYSDTFATIRNILADYPKFCRFSAENDRLLLADFGAMLFMQSEKEIAEPRNSTNLHMANKSTPNRAIFVCSPRTPQRTPEALRGSERLSMVACNGKGSPFAVFHMSQFSSPLHVTAQTLESLAVALQKSHMELLAMLFKFLITGSRRLTISIRANSETEARQRLQLSDNALCVARYTDAFLAKKQANFTACKGACYA